MNFLLIYKSDNEVVRYGIIPYFIASSEHVQLIIIVRIIICEKGKKIKPITQWANMRKKVQYRDVQQYEVKTISKSVYF